MDVARQRFDPFTQFTGKPRQLRVLLEKLKDLGRLFRGEFLALHARSRDRLPVPRISIGERLVPICLPRLREQDQRRRVRRLEAEREVQEDKRIEIEPRQTPGVR